MWAVVSAAIVWYKHASAGEIACSTTLDMHEGISIVSQIPSSDLSSSADAMRSPGIRLVGLQIILGR